MQHIAEVREIIDELEAKLESYTDKTLWQKSNVSEWYPWILEEGPKIIASWRELAGMVSLMNGDQLLDLLNKWEQMLMMINQEETLALALKFKRRNDAPPKNES